MAGYARVSTDLEEQQSSYDAQMDYYSSYIKTREDWEFVGMYSDEGISATSTNRRIGFKQMVDDALEGKLDLIITKSVSRFARNTVDSLTTVRKLKDHGVEIYFEKENIWTLDAKGELLITIMSSLAQEESRSISENTTWGQRKRFADGKASVAYKRFLGYDRGPNGGFIVNKEQAKTVKRIYKYFLEGMTYYGIARKLTELEEPTPGGQKKWHTKTVESILTNEKYKGDALLQKSYTVDFLSKKMKKNEGEVPQYYVENNHEAIIDPATFDLVQAEVLRRAKAKGSRYSGVGIFSSIIMCGECGSWYGAKVWHSNDKYRRVIYRCNHKYSDGCRCKTPHITEEEIKELFLKAVNELFSGKAEIITNTKEMMELVCNTDALDKEVADCIVELNIISEQMQSAILENSRVALNQEEYEKRYAALTERYNATKEKYDKATEQIEAKKAQRELIKGFNRTLENTGNVAEEFDAGMWCGLVDHVMVTDKDNIVFTFKNGLEVKTS